MKENIDFVNRAFINCFSDKKYQRERSVDISSGVDQSVTYIGSGISVLKPLMLSGDIHTRGNFIKQKAIRTQSLKNIYDTDCVTEFSSFFDALCVLTNYEKLDDLVKDSFSFFTEYLGVKPEDIMLRINSSDRDLIVATSDVSSKIKREFDTRPLKYYQHKYGLDQQGIYGRNLNFAFREKKSGEYKDVGNIIVIESQNKKYATELALGVQPTVMRMHDIPTSLQASYIADVIDINSVKKLKYAECLVAVANLQRENVINMKGKRYPIYLYKRYLKALKFWQEQLGIGKAELIKTIEQYLEMEYNPEFEFHKSVQEQPEERVSTGKGRED